MLTPIKMPQLGESVVDGTVARWLKAPGDPVEKLEPLLEVSTDKIDTEIPAPISGTFLAIIVAEGETVDAGTIIGYIGEAGDAVPTEETADPVMEMMSNPTSTQAGADASIETPAAPPRTTSPDARPSGREFISPVVGRIAADHDVDLSQINGTGMNGRVTKKDLLAYLDEANDAERVKVQPGVADLAQTTQNAMGGQSQPLLPAQPAASMDGASSPLSLNQDETLHPLTTMRRAIAQHMVQSKATSPHVTTVFEVDLSRVVLNREAEKAHFAGRGIALNFTAYFVAATAAALRNEPMVNSRFTDDGIVTQRRIHIGVAVAVDDGLVVPVLRDADELNLPGVARGVQELSQRARTGQLSADDLHGGTFTISNHGVGGSLVGTPIINQPQAAILGVGSIVKRPVVRSSSPTLLPSADDAIVIRPMCYLSLTFDHRILDGAVADRFVRWIKERLENWEQ